MPGTRVIELHALSGGLDSTLALLLALQEGRQVLAHHVDLDDGTGRDAFESVAARAVAVQLAKDGLPVELLVSSYSIGTSGRATFHDNIVAWMQSGLVLRQRRDISTFVSCGHLDAFSPRWRTTARDAQRRRDAILTAVAGRPIRVRTPLADMTKADIVAALPEQYRRLCWWCRRLNNGSPCGECMTCRQVQGANA